MFPCEKSCVNAVHLENKSSMTHCLFKSLFHQVFCGVFLPQTEYGVQTKKKVYSKMLPFASRYLKGERRLICIWNSSPEHCLPRSLISPAVRRDCTCSHSLPQNEVQYQEGCKGLMRCSQGSFTTCAFCFCLQVQNCCWREEIYMNKSSEVKHS